MDEAAMIAMKLIRGLIGFFTRSPRTEEIEKIVNNIQNTLSQAHDEYNSMRNMLVELSKTVHAIDGFIWRKDIEGKYVFANRAFCNRLLVPDRAEIKTTVECTEQILGHTDEDIMSQYIMRTGDYNTFWNTIPIADQYVYDNRIRTEMIEFGKINNQPIAIRTIRTPLFIKDGQFSGIIGFSIDVSNQCRSILSQVKDWVEKGLAHQIHPHIFVLKDRDCDQCDLPEGALADIDQF